MPRFAAFLRAVNVGGHNVKMEALRDLFSGLGLDDVTSVLASGNLTFSTRARSTPALETRIEKMLLAELGYPVSTFLRTSGELAGVLAHEPFSPSKVAAAGALNVAFHKEPLDAAGRGRLAGLVTDADTFHAHGREIWWLSRVKQSESKFTIKAFEKGLGQAATFRGLGTIGKVLARLESG